MPTRCEIHTFLYENKFCKAIIFIYIWKSLEKITHADTHRHASEREALQPLLLTQKCRVTFQQLQITLGLQNGRSFSTKSPLVVTKITGCSRPRCMWGFTEQRKDFCYLNNCDKHLYRSGFFRIAVAIACLVGSRSGAGVQGFIKYWKIYFGSSGFNTHTLNYEPLNAKQNCYTTSHTNTFAKRTRKVCSSSSSSMWNVKQLGC